MNKGDRTTETRTKKAGPGIPVAAIFVLTLLAPFHALGEEGGYQKITFKPDPELQAAIKGVANPRTRQEYEKHLHILQERGARKNNYQKLIPQLLYYHMYGTDLQGKHGMKEAMAFGGIAELLEISERSIARALLPYVEMEDDDIKKAVLKFLRDYEHRGPKEHPDYSLYRSIIASRFRKGEEPPLSLVRHMYETAPGTALLSLMRASRLPDRNETRTIRWAEHVIADVLWKHKHKFLNADQVEPAAAEQLEKLSQNNHWWVRLYVGEIMRQHPGFRRPEIVERLKQDKHPLVRKSMAFAETTD